jgi:hypothetical protein
MRLFRLLIISLKWIFTLGAVAGALVGAYFVHEQMAAERAAEGGEGTKPAGTLNSAGDISIKASTARDSLTVAKLKEVEWVPRASVYGRVVANPSATSEVRAAFAGRLRPANGKKWPGLAAHVKAGDVLGLLEVRGPQDRLDLQSKLTEAKARLEGTRKLLSIQQERVDRFKAAPSSFARSELDAALVALAEAETQLSTSEAAVKLWQEALTALDQAGDLKQVTWTMPVTAPGDGEVTELLARPDMVLESGGLIARVVDFGKVLVRVDIPLNLRTTPLPTLELFVLPALPPAFEGPTNQPEPPTTPQAVPTELVGISPQVDPTLQATGYLYKLASGAGKEPGGLDLALWRPGLFVKGYLPINAAKPVSGFAVPRSALLFHQGRALIYRRVYPSEPPQPGPPAKFHTFRRVEVNVLGRDGDTWIVTAGLDLTAGDLVVTEGALLLLSEEFRSTVDND